MRIGKVAACKAAACKPVVIRRDIFKFAVLIAHIQLYNVGDALQKLVFRKEQLFTAVIGKVAQYVGEQRAAALVFKIFLLFHRGDPVSGSSEHVRFVVQHVLPCGFRCGGERYVRFAEHGQREGVGHRQQHLTLFGAAGRHDGLVQLIPLHELRVLDVVIQRQEKPGFHRFFGHTEQRFDICCHVIDAAVAGDDEHIRPPPDMISVRTRSSAVSRSVPSRGRYSNDTFSGPPEAFYGVHQVIKRVFRGLALCVAGAVL